MTTRAIESSINELKTIQSEVENIEGFLEWRPLSTEQYSTEYKDIQTKLDGLRKRFNNILQIITQNKNDIKPEEEIALKPLLDSFKKLNTDFWELKTPLEFATKLDELKPKIHEIKNWPKTAMFDYELTERTIKQIVPEKMIAKKWSIEYYIVNVPPSSKITAPSWKMVLRIDRNSSWEEVALLKISVPSWNDEQIVEEIESAEISTSWEVFKDVEVDWHNAWNTNWQTLVEWYEWIQDATMWVVGAAWGYLAWKGIATWAGMTAAWIAWESRAKGLVATWKAKALSVARAKVWAVAWAKVATTWMAAWIAWKGIIWTVLGWWKVILIWWTGFAVGTIWAVPTAIIAWTAVVGWVATWILTDADLTTKRAEQFWLTAKLDIVKNIWNTMNYKT